MDLIYYRQERSWDKVIFSEACVKNSVHWELYPSMQWDQRQTSPPREQTPLQDQRQTLPTPLKEQTPPPPGAVHAGRYRQQAGGTHPTGMHTCFYYYEQIRYYLSTQRRLSVMQSIGRVEKLIGEKSGQNPQYTPNVHQMSGQMGGKGEWFFTRDDHLKITPPKWKLLMENFNIVETSLYTGK